MSDLILIVEDEVKITALLEDYLHDANFETAVIHHGDEVLPWLETHNPQLILLDLMLPGTDGMSICREVRKTSNTPIIMLTARVEEIDRLLGLELGADDYICKPFSPREVVARIKAVLRRFSVNAQDTPPSSGLELDETRYLLKYHNAHISLTAVEFNLLKTLLNRPGQIFSRNQLMDTIYDDHRIVSSRTIDSHIKKIRKKLTELGLKDETIHSVYGVGYKFE
ncbi:MAG: response regulator [Proteobacteria bacterium]|nr:response regulator [Pseudomonadota bacterium]